MAGELQQPPAQDVQSEVSEDGSTWTARATIGPSGVYDPEKQPTPKEIIAMKAEFNRTDIIENAAPKVCTQIVLDMLTTTDTSNPHEFDEDSIYAGITDTEGAPVFFRQGYNNIFKAAEQVGQLASHWTQGLLSACALPGAKWPEYMTPPATFSEVLREVKAVELHKRTQSLIDKGRDDGDHSS